MAKCFNCGGAGRVPKMCDGHLNLACPKCRHGLVWRPCVVCRGKGED